MKMTKKVLSILLSVVMLVGLLPVSAFATEPDYAYISVCEDGQFVADPNGEAMAYRAVPLNELTAIDLNAYGLSDYLYDKDEDGSYEITALHLYIYVHEQLLGLDFNDVDTSNGSPGSMYFSAGLFGCADENLRYNYNGAYPADENGWGFTADRIVLTDGDFFEVAHFSDWSFFMDSAYGFHYFTDENDNVGISYTAQAGTELPLKLTLVGGGMGMGSTNMPEMYYTVYYGQSVGNPTDTVTTDDNGAFSVTFPSAGTWYVWCDGGYGIDMAPGAIVSAPACAVITVEQDTDPDQEAADAVIEKINVIGEVGLDKESLIIDARSAYDALNDTRKSLVTNYTTLIAAEERLQQLKDEAAQAVADQEAADAVIAKINAIGEVGLDKERLITDARSAYDALNDTRKSLVTNYITLTAAEECLQQLKDEAAKAAADQAVADAVKEKITDIGTVTAFSGKKIDTARAAFDALTDDQKNLVDNAAVLTAAESTLTELYKQAAKADHKSIYAATGKYIAALGTPYVGSVGGEWMVIDLTRAGQSCPEGYYKNVVDYVKAEINDKEQLHRVKSTENSRVILGLTAAGYDVTNVAGHNLLMGLTDMTYLPKQGINGPIWALIAFDCRGYEIPTNPNATEQVTREKLIAYILEKQLADGGWALSGQVADPDMTGMAMQALAPYYKTNTAVKAAVDKALVCLSEKQMANGGYGSIDGVCTESCAQVIVALTALGIDPETDPRFVKNGISVVDAMCLFAVEGGGFAHIPNDGVNGMATEQGQYALAAYFRFKNGQTALYDMSDVILRSNNEGIGKVENNTDTKENAFAGALEMPAKELADALLSEEEEKLVESGINVNIDLIVADITEEVSSADKALVEKSLGSNTVGLYLDITLTKQLGDTEPVKVTETNGAVTVTVVVPEILRNTDAKIDRTYKVVRVHEGKTDILDADYDAKTGKLSFQTDCFSTYAVVYTDMPVPSNPKTGDNTPIVLFASLMVTSAACLVVSILSKKKYAQ